VKAVGYEEFAEALLQALPLETIQQAQTVGIAVSGGVDSMALATLYAGSRASQQLPQLHGFIIDHKARAESTEEAHWVAEQLSNSKISILTSLLFHMLIHCSGRRLYYYPARLA
jgi:tRNA(Ile)-lysidine synthase